jgi:two-component system, LytTR family, response regulator
MTRVLIIEDEKLAADGLWEEVIKIRPEYELISIEDSVKGSIKAIDSRNPDLIFMDIHLSDGISFDIFTKIEVTQPIIFTTAYDEYAIDAFRHNSVHYLLKPINPKSLKEAISKFESNGISLNTVLSHLADQVKKQHYQKRFSVQVRDKIHSIPVEEVAYFLGEDKSVHIFSFDGKKYLLDTTLKELEDRLDPREFFRINRKFIVSFKSIQEMVAYSKSRVKVILNPEPLNPLDAIVSVERSPKFKKWISR